MIGWGLATFAPIGVGLLLATRRTRNPIGWLLLGNGAVLATVGIAEARGDADEQQRPGSLADQPRSLISPAR